MLSLDILLAFSLFTTINPIRASLLPRADASPRPIAQLFEWNWKSIGDECKSSLGPSGYGYVQVSPPQESITGPQWYTSYQPVSYQLVSKRGNRDDFKSMVKKCHDAGVKVIADTIWNHMTGNDSGTGIAGSVYAHYSYPNIYQPQDFHHCGFTQYDDIENPTDRVQSQFCELTNLADLATERDNVQSTLAKYGDDLVSLGVDGFRLDAAKNIPSSDIASILGRLKTKPPFITQEVIWGPADQIQPPEYMQNGKVHEFRFASLMKEAFTSGAINNLTDLDSRGWIPSGQANVFVSNHDTERNGNSLNYSSPNNIYNLAHVFMLAYPYGQPTVLSSFTYSNQDDGAPQSGSGSCSGDGGANGYNCFHRVFAGLIPFYNTIYPDSSISNYVSPSVSRIAFGRGNLGFVAINAGSDTWSGSLETQLKDGSYCDVVVGPMDGTKCKGNVYTVSNGSFDVNIPANSAIAIHLNAVSGKKSTSGALPRLAPATIWLPVLSTLAYYMLF